MAFLGAILRRLIGLAAVLLAMSVMAFSLINLIPGDAARVAAGPGARPEQVEELRHEYGLDRPLVAQFAFYLGRVVRGDLGQSLHTRRSINEDLREFAPVTLELVALSTIIVIIGGFSLGIVLGAARGGWSYRVADAVSLVGLSAPPFLLAIIFQLVFFADLGWFPAIGRLDPTLTAPDGPTGSYILDGLIGGQPAIAWNAVLHLVLPCVALAFGPLAASARMVRSSLHDALGEEFVRTARMHGIPELRVILRHALPAALLPPIALLGLQIGSLIAWSIIVELIFGLPGLGRYLLDSIASKDLQAILSTTLFIGVVFVVMNALVDVVTTVADPRLRA
jgi:peptide/nickel transport system permease protein